MHKEVLISRPPVYRNIFQIMFFFPYKLTNPILEIPLQTSVSAVWLGNPEHCHPLWYWRWQHSLIPCPRNGYCQGQCSGAWNEFIPKHNPLGIFVAVTASPLLTTVVTECSENRRGAPLLSVVVIGCSEKQKDPRKVYFLLRLPRCYQDTKAPISSYICVKQPQDIC